MNTQATQKHLSKTQRTGRTFYIYLYTYLIIFFVCIALTITICLLDDKNYIWFWFAMGIGGIYVLIAFYYFYENYLQPYLTDIQRSIQNNIGESDQLEIISKFPKDISSWSLEWFIPAFVLHYEPF